MNSRIELWERQYRVRTAEAAARLDAISTAALAAYDDAVRATSVNADELILIRDIHIHLVLDFATFSESALSAAWGRAMAAAVLRAIANGDGVVRYRNFAVYLAEYISALAHGRKVEEWVFARFAPQRRNNPRATIVALLLDYPEAASAALPELLARGELPRVLRVLGSQATAVWSRVFCGLPATNAAQERPLFAAAVQILLALGHRDVAARAESLFTQFVSQPRPATDWNDRAHLAAAVLAAVQFVLAREPLPQAPTHTEIHAAVAQLEWLDREWLAARLQGLAEAKPELPRTRIVARTESPRHREWLQTVRAVLPRIVLLLDRANLASAHNSLLLLTAIIAEQPAWANDSGLPPFVAALLNAARELALGEMLPARSPLAEQITHTHGEMGRDVVRAIATNTALPPATFAAHANETHRVPTAAAGVFLLFRAFSDLRLPALARTAAYPCSGERGAQAMRYAVAAKLSGQSVCEPYDAGLLAFAGLTAEHATTCLESWATATEANREEFQRLLARALRGHRLLGESLTVAVVPHASGWLQVAGDPESNLWPFVVARDLPDVCAHTATQWREAWADILDEEPQLQQADAPASLIAMIESFAVPAIEEPQGEAIIAVTAQAVMRTWARWLGRLSSSSTPYLLSQLVRRPGWLTRNHDELIIELEPRPLDVALEVAGYLEPLELPPGWGVRVVRFQIGGTP